MSAIATRRWCRINGCSTEPDEGSEFCRTHRFSAGETNGRELLDRMDAGEPLTEPAPEENEAPEETAGTDGDKALHEKWSPEEVVAAIQRWAAEHGRPPTQKDWIRRGSQAFRSVVGRCSRRRLRAGQARPHKTGAGTTGGSRRRSWGCPG